MLGPALTRQLLLLLNIPEETRTEEQQSMLSELVFISHAAPAVYIPDSLRKSVLSDTNLDVLVDSVILSMITKPTGERKCSKCNQYFPVMSSPPK